MWQFTEMFVKNLTFMEIMTSKNSQKLDPLQITAGQDMLAFQRYFGARN